MKYRLYYKKHRDTALIMADNYGDHIEEEELNTDYDLVYEDYVDCTEDEIGEIVFHKFNINFPPVVDRPMRGGDIIVVINNDGIKSAHIALSFGWKVVKIKEV